MPTSMLPKPVPWIHLLTPFEAEAWIENLNQALQQSLPEVSTSGYGVCFSLAEGGDIFLHSTSEGYVLLDVTPDAQWAAPVIAAAVNVAQPGSQIWHFPDDNLVQLVLGLSSLVASTTMVLRHDFHLNRKRIPSPR